MSLFEVNEAAAIIKETAHPDVNLIFGAVIDDNMSDDIRITVIATGFETTGMPRNIMERSMPRPKSAPAQPKAEASAPAQDVFAPRSFNTEDLDIPTFLRNRVRS
jgi:cell division protein FtsZ